MIELINKEKIMEPMKTLKEQLEAKRELYSSFIKASKKFRKPNFTKAVNYGRTNFKYADLPEILDCVSEALLNEGLFIVHEFYDENEYHWIKTYLQHENGLTMGNVIFPITVKNKTMQEIGAQITYLKRYSIASICNLCADEDNDAKEIEDQKVNVEETLTINQIKEIESLLEDLPIIEKQGLLRWCQVKDIHLIPRSKFVAAKKALEAKIKGGN